MPRIRPVNQSRISFFAFQDIIVSVTGVLLLVSLLLAFFVQTAAVEIESGARSPDELREALDAAEHELRELADRTTELAVLLAERDAAPPSDQVRTRIALARLELANVQTERDRLAKEVETLEALQRQLAESLGLEQLHRRLDALRAELRATAGELAEALRESARAGQQIEAGRRQLARLEAVASQLWLIPDSSRTDKSARLILVSGDQIQFGSFEAGSWSEPVLSRSAATEFADRLNRWSPGEHFLVFYVRPSGIAQFEQLRDAARTAGFEIGYDAAAEEQPVHLGPPPKP